MVEAINRSYICSEIILELNFFESPALFLRGTLNLELSTSQPANQLVETESGWLLTCVMERREES